jgi:hypothetical protein
MKIRNSILVATIIIMSIFALAAYAIEPFLIDDFEKEGNNLGARSNTYEKEPSRALAMRISEEHFGGAGRALMVKYDKKKEGGPYGTGGWCGYYTMLRSGAKFFDTTPYKAITFQVKGAAGGENFKVGLADKHWEELGDSVKSEDITKYLPEAKITTNWQKATIPLDTFFVEHKEIASCAICFENECFPTGAAKGTVYIDDLKLE